MYRKKNQKHPTVVPLRRGAGDPRTTLAFCVISFDILRRVCSHIYCEYSTPSWQDQMGVWVELTIQKPWFPLDTRGRRGARRAWNAAPRRLNPQVSVLRKEESPGRPRHCNSNVADLCTHF